MSRQRMERAAILIVAFTALSVVVIGLLPGWNWALYDELKWVGEYVRDQGSVMSYLRDDWANTRFRPTSIAAVYAKFHALGFNYLCLHAARLVEWVALGALLTAVLRTLCGLPLLLALTGMALAFKSPPLLEQIRVTTLSELTALWIFCAGLMLRRRNRLLAFPVLLLAVFSKEPLPLLLLLPPLREKRWKELALTTAAVGVFFISLYLNRRGYSAGYGSVMTATALAEIARQLAVEAAFLVPLALGAALASRSARLDAIAKQRLWDGASFLAIALGYALLVLPMAWGYTYIFAPATTLAACGLACMAAALAPAPEPATFPKGLAPGALYFSALVTIAMGAVRVERNWVKVAQSAESRSEMFTFVRELPGHPSVASNCSSDGRSISFGADIPQRTTPFEARTDGPYCLNPDQDLKSCCGGMPYFVVGNECAYPELRHSQAAGLGVKPVFQNERWAVYPCP